MTITSSTAICNLALDLLSAGTVIDIDNPSNPTESLLNRWYDQSRRKCLREHPWNFAISREVLAATSTSPPFGYAKAFRLPADFLRLMYISAPLVSDRDTILPATSYKIERGSILINDNYGDSNSLNIIYVSDFTTVAQFDPLFVDLLAYEIALSVAYKVTDSNTNIKRLGEIHKRRSAIARAIDGQENPPQRIQYSRARNARRNNQGQDHRIVF